MSDEHDRSQHDDAPRRLIDADEVAAMLGGGSITGDTVNRSRKRWGLPARKVGKFIRYDADEIADYIRNITA